MPSIIEPECPNCKNPNLLTFHGDGSIWFRRCQCSKLTWNVWEVGQAFLKQHWWALRVLLFADKLGDCLSEFSGPIGVGGKCLCDSCAERIEDLDGAVAAAKEMGNTIPELGV